jgi:hypothetical protein
MRLRLPSISCGSPRRHAEKGYDRVREHVEECCFIRVRRVLINLYMNNY